MQELVIIDNGSVVVQGTDYTYSNTYDQFLKDGGSPLPDGVTSLDYNKTYQVCVINGVIQENGSYPYGDALIAKAKDFSDLLIKALEDRRAIERAEKEKQDQAKKEQEEKERLENMTLEELKAQKVLEADDQLRRLYSPVNRELWFNCSLGFKVGGDTATSNLVQDNIDYFSSLATPTSEPNTLIIPFIDFDDVSHELTLDNFKIVQQELTSYRYSALLDIKAFSNSIKASASKEDLKSLSFSLLHEVRLPFVYPV